MPKLLELDIQWPSGLLFTQEDIESVAKSLPSLTSIFLSECPLLRHPPSLTLLALVPFARHCLDINTIGLYVDGDATVTIPEEMDQLFHKLRRIRFGLSPLSTDNAQRVALSLSHLCTAESKKCLIRSGFTWERPFMDLLPEEERQFRILGWDVVAEYFPVLVAVRDEERSKMRRLEAELKSLRRQSSPMKSDS